MPAYRVAGSLTYGSTANGNSARNAMQATVSTLGLTGVVTVGGSGATVTISGTAPDEATAAQLEAAMVPNWSVAARTSGHVGVSRV